MGQADWSELSVMNFVEIHDWLRETDDRRLEELWRTADDVRRRNVGDEVHLRGLTEFSNHCVRRCAYCGLGTHTRGLERYRMNADEILACADRAVELEYGTIVLQSGQDSGVSGQWLADVIERIRQQTPLAVTLSVGERSEDELALWRRAGAGRYLLRFETSDRTLYERIHPDLPAGQAGLNGVRSDRIAILHQLRELGYEVGSGVMIGLPGQTYETLARDIELFGELDLDMIGSGPFIPNPHTPLARNGDKHPAPADRQVPNSETMSYKVIALTRIICPQANIPATTAVATLNGRTGYESGLRRGANVVMPNVTPPRYRALYEIYPAKAGVEQDGDYHSLLKERILAIGGRVGEGRGDSLNYINRRITNKEVATCAR